MPINGINQYTCDECRGTIVTVDRDEGVTPFMLGCRAKPGCTGLMRSSFYSLPTIPRPSWEWYKPQFEEELKKLDHQTREHVKLGGLLLRQIPPNGERIENPIVKKAIEYISNKETISIAELQRKFRIIYPTAVRVIEELVNRRYIDATKDKSGRHRVIHIQEGDNHELR